MDATAVDRTRNQAWNGSQVLLSRLPSLYMRHKSRGYMLSKKLSVPIESMIRLSLPYRRLGDDRQRLFSCGCGAELPEWSLM